MTNHVQIVVTPGSGEGRALGTARRLAKLLMRGGHRVHSKKFTDLRTLAEWAKSCTPEFSHLVCVGGDATLSAAAVAAVRCNIPFVPVPNGFGNVFARVFGHPERAEAAARLVDEGELRRVDVGVVGTDEIFLSHRSYGALERIQQTVERGRQQPRSRFLRHLAYYGMAKRFLFDRPRGQIRVEIDGTLVHDDAVLVTVANVETYRGFLSLTPKASPIDGRFDVFVVPRVSAAGLGWRLMKLMFRLPGRWKGVTTYRGRRVTVTTPSRREELRTERRALPLIVPRGAIEAIRQRVVEEDAPVTTVS